MPNKDSLNKEKDKDKLNYTDNLKQLGWTEKWRPERMELLAKERVEQRRRRMIQDDMRLERAEKAAKVHMTDPVMTEARHHDDPRAARHEECPC